MLIDAFVQGRQTLRNRLYVPTSEQKSVNLDLHVLLPTLYALLSIAVCGTDLHGYLIALAVRIVLFDPVVNIAKADPVFSVGESALLDLLLRLCADTLHLSVEFFSGLWRTLVAMALVAVLLTSCQTSRSGVEPLKGVVPTAAIDGLPAPDVRFKRPSFARSLGGTVASIFSGKQKDKSRTTINNYYAPAKMKNSTLATDQASVTDAKKAHAPVATGTSSAIDNTKAGQKGGAAATGEGSSAQASTEKSGIPYVWLLVVALVALLIWKRKALLPFWFPTLCLALCLLSAPAKAQTLAAAQPGRMIPVVRDEPAKYKRVYRKALRRIQRQQRRRQARAYRLHMNH
ncbi:hypothetical protein [Hymenobacter sp. BT491]|uniref:hypothetical protein n=1 Tax=Hymenobacter sp. BT491 TaxID=2766779 RepID=UPI00165345AB|nr:hypothetical protein [Hymenobacter sp. BT491]MBC6988571.1 hypothetical protein [Hymenobacter sp. BT491]